MAYPDFFPRRVNMRVDKLKYAADASEQDPYRVDYGAPLALSTTYFMNAVLQTTGVPMTATVGNGIILNNGEVPDATTSRWGRGLTLVASAASTRTITMVAYDYLGQRISWTGVMNGTTPVVVTKMIRWIESIVFGASADTVTISVGYNEVLGIPYAGQMLAQEIKNGAVAANAGTFTAAVLTNPQTATTGDPKGSYTPATVLPNGTNTFSLLYIIDRTTATGMHGVAHFGG